MPFLSPPPDLHQCKPPSTYFRGKLRPVGTRWYCPRCFSIWTLVKAGEHYDTGEPLHAWSQTKEKHDPAVQSS